MSIYANTSPYYLTDLSKGYLDVMSPRNIPAEADDILFTVTNTYEHRPDLLAHHLYANVKLWWVFAARNPSVIKDPVYDLNAGVKIYIPKITTLNTSLGI